MSKRDRVWALITVISLLLVLLLLLLRIHLYGLG